ncbi:winged helix-turn-helix domain-containing protein [Halobaculum rarum]|uniref:winged helix-turn-helix domain-containing protein n=1 Tax=Halobaculum rarum TaxID=3075122 RepID=UPI003D68B567
MWQYGQMDDEASRRTFELLANETRLGIISALGEASGEGGYATLAFSELQAVTGVEDNGQFNYHLKKLIGEFIEDREGGYALTLAGIRAYQAIVAHRFDAEIEVEPFEPADIVDCEHCGGTMNAWYEDGRLRIACTDCGESVMYYPVPVSNFDTDDPRSLVSAAKTRLIRDESSMLHGICPYCAGRTNWSIGPTQGYWEEKNLRDHDAVVHVACERCAWFMYGNVAGKIRFHPTVSTFLIDHGLDPWSLPPWSLPYERSEEVTDIDPLQVEVVFEIDGDRLTVIVDEEMNVVDNHTESYKSESN